MVRRFRDLSIGEQREISLRRFSCEDRTKRKARTYQLLALYWGRRIAGVDHRTAVKQAAKAFLKQPLYQVDNAIEQLIARLS